MSKSNGSTRAIYDPAKCIPVVLAAIMEGESLRSVCQNNDDLPSAPHFLRWVGDDEALAEQYARAREVQAQCLADEIFDIADDAQNDWMERYSRGEAVGWTENGEALQRSRLRVDARKWYLSKVLPKVYGDKGTSIHVGDVNQTLTVETGPADMGKWLADIAGRLSGRNGDS